MWSSDCTVELASAARVLIVIQLVPPLSSLTFQAYVLNAIASSSSSLTFQAYVFMLLRVHYRIHGHELQRAQCKMGLLQVPILAGDP